MIVWKNVILGASFAVIVGGTAHAADYNQFQFTDAELTVPAQQHVQYDENRRYGGDEYGYRRRDRWEERREWDRPGYGRPWWRHDREDCRVVVRRHVNSWGQVTERRTRICR